MRAYWEADGQDRADRERRVRTDSGRFSDLLTITGGTGEWDGASGQLHLFGTFSFEAGTSEGDYRGEICRS